MKAATMEGPKQFVIKDIPKPTPGPSEVIVRTRACAVCGSDLTVYKLGIPDRILGHEFSGDIVEIGDRVKGWKTGDRVVIEPQLSCGECHWCKTKQFNLCDSLEYTGLATDGGFAEFVRVPAYQLHLLPDNINYEHGALMEPLAVAIRGVRLSQIKPGDSVAVFGCGSIGLFTMLWARKMGAKKVIALDIVPTRAQQAQQLADSILNPAEITASEEIIKLTDNIGADIIFECSGNPQAQQDAIESVRKGGQIVLLGIGYEPTPVMFMQLTMKEIGLKGSLGYSSLTNDSEFLTAINAVTARDIDITRIPSNTFKLDDIGKAFEKSLNGDVAKAIVLI
jgi:(R,R)-butanediol dehydrogenase / meso-butanediol dehydrogenase / diacetyl reductase